ncbi:MAG TPA: polyphosphate kinase 1 [Longimicrobiales bacterium]|nr:polyphosphate kinase 1 [Longimicrobiales bacterium]
MRRRLSLRVASETLLERVAASPRALGMRTGRTSYEVLRETYFDTSDRALRDRRMTLRLSLTAAGRKTLELLIASGVNLEGVVDEEVLSTPLSAGQGMYATLRGTSELATRIREAVDPVGLRPLLALDIDRETTDLKVGWLGRVVRRVTFDRILAHWQGDTRALHEITLLEEFAGGPALGVLSERLLARFDIVHDGLDTLERAQRDLRGGDASRIGEEPSEARAVVVLLREGAVGLVPGGAGMTLPTTMGTGEDVASRVTLEVLGSVPKHAEPELVGFATSRSNEPDLEVWLCESPPEATAGETVLWVPLVEVLGRAGAPGLRDPTLTAALLLLVRAEIGVRLLREAPPVRSAPVAIPSTRPEGMKPGEHPGDFLDTELSILDFNLRVLELAEDPDVPLLERFRFLSIFASNMDEFFVVRVGRLKTRTDEPEDPPSGDLSPAELLDLIHIRVRALIARQYACLRQLLLPALAEKGVRLRRWEEVNLEAQTVLSRHFEEEIFPLLTPRAMTASPGHPFPRLESLGLSLAALLRDADGTRAHVAHVPIPRSLPRLVPVPGSRDLIPVEEIIEAHATALFPAFDLAEVHAFRVSRSGDVDIDEDLADSLLASIEDEVEARPYKPVVRLEVQGTMPREVRAQLLRELRSEAGGDSSVLNRGDVFEVDGPLDLRSFDEVARLDIPGEGYPSFTARRPLPLERPLFDIIDEGDVLLHHPYVSFDDTVGRLLQEAADDPSVVSIKLTLYRTGRDSPLADALLRALKNGKDVFAFVELKARFDEESNIHWTRRITEAGGHVVYGLVGFKTHAKTLLIVRKHGSGVRRYVHIGTGNYNAATARFYTDLGLMSADPDLGAELNDFFNELMGSAGPPAKKYRHLWVAPNSMASELTKRIRREVEHAEAGRPAKIEAKLNGIADRKVVRALYEAAGAGVEIDLIVRAICTLRPAVPGLSQGIRVRSILGRFLEHARVYYFLNGGDEEYFIGSADWRKRNLRKRVEVATPVRGQAGRALLRAILDRELDDPRAWELRPDGSYERLQGQGPTAQDHFTP